MWAIVVVSVNLLLGPQTGVVTEAGTFQTEEACNAALAESVPGKLDKDTEKAWKEGYRRYACVRAIAPEAH
jgi:hypothetical protein